MIHRAAQIILDMEAVVQYPLQMTFKIVAVAPQINVTDAHGNSVCYVKQKLFKLKESVNVFQDATQTNLLCQINADRIIDFSAFYKFTDPQGDTFGGVRRKGMKSIWKAHYEVVDETGNSSMTIEEANPWTKVADSFFGELPFVGVLSGYLFHPAYFVKRMGGEAVFKAQKQPAFFESKYSIEKMADCDPVDELRVLMAAIMMVLLERQRG